MTNLICIEQSRIIDKSRYGFNLFARLVSKLGQALSGRGDGRTLQSGGGQSRLNALFGYLYYINPRPTGVFL